MLKRLPLAIFSVLFMLFIGACGYDANCWNIYRPVYFANKEDSLTFSKILRGKKIESITLSDIELEFANFPLPEKKNWSEIEHMVGEDPRQDKFIQSVPTLFKAGDYSIVYVPKSYTASQLRKTARSLNIPIFFGPQEISIFKKGLYLTCFALVGILWIFLRPSQAFFLLFAQILGLFFINDCTISYYMLVTCFFAYATLLENWAKHYRQVRYTGTPLIKTIKRATLSLTIYLSFYLASLLVIACQEEALKNLTNLYFLLLFFSFLIWIYWVANRQDKKLNSSLFPANIINKNLTIYTSKGYLYTIAILVGIAPFFFLILCPSLPQAKQYIVAREALYPQLNRTSLLILYRTPSDYPTLASYLAHRFYQQTLPFVYEQGFGFPPKGEVIKRKTYNFDGIHFKEEKENIVISLSDEWIDREVRNLPDFWHILLSRENKLVLYKTSSEPFMLFNPVEKRLISLCLLFFVIFSLKLKSYFRIIS